MKYKTFNNILKLILITSSACYCSEILPDADKENAGAITLSYRYETRSKNKNAIRKNAADEEAKASDRSKRKREIPPLQPQNPNTAQDQMNFEEITFTDELAKKRKINSDTVGAAQDQYDRPQTIHQSDLGSEHSHTKEKFIDTVRDFLNTGKKPAAKKLVLDKLQSTPAWLKDLIHQLSAQEATAVELDAAAFFLYEIFKKNNEYANEILDELSNTDLIRKNYVAGCAIAFIRDENIIFGNEIYDHLTMRSSSGSINTLLCCLDALGNHPRISAKKSTVDLLASNLGPKVDMGIQSLKYFIVLDKVWARNILLFCLKHQNEQYREYAFKAIKLLLQENHAYPKALLKALIDSKVYFDKMFGLNMLERLLCTESGYNLEPLTWEIITVHCGDEVVDRYQSSGISAYTALVDNKYFFTTSFGESFNF